MSERKLAIQIQSLSRAFRGKPALREISLEVPTGSVFGLVGLNGAGKTTLIRHIIGSMRALHGSVTVLGQDPTQQPETLLARIGYMTEEDSLPTWMRVSDLIQFCQAVYPTWSNQYAKELCEMFSLSPKSSLKSLSKGGRARAALLAAIAHRPELLILDEPSSGLDPIARADILEAIIRTTVDDGRTVLFSSHLLDEIDRVCDSLALIHEGELIETIASEELSTRYVEAVYRCESPHSPLILSGAFGLTTSVAPGTSPSGGATEASVVIDREHREGALPPESVEQDDARWTLIDQRPASIHRWFAGRVRLQPESIDANLREVPSNV